MTFLEKDFVYSHLTYESILALPEAPKITRGIQGKKHEGRAHFKEALDKSGLIIANASFPSGFDPLKEKESFDEYSLLEKLTILSAYHYSYIKDSSVFDAGLFNETIDNLISSLKEEALYLIKNEEEKEDVKLYAFFSKGLMETPLTVLAFDIAYDAFKNDVDKGDMPYIYHPIRVALRCDEEKAIATALLHDVIEDHADIYSPEVLLDKGIPGDIVKAVGLLTHEKNVPYLKYVLKIAKNDIARAVKRGDLLDNLDETRNGEKHSPKSLYYFKSLSLIERYPDLESEENEYYYDMENDAFVKKNEHGVFLLHKGEYIQPTFKTYFENVVDLTFFPGDPCLKENVLPYFDSNGEIILDE